MKKRLPLLAGIGGAAFALVLALVAYFIWSSFAYVDTLHARVVGSVVTVRSPAAGRVVELKAQVGDTFAQNGELAVLAIASQGSAGTGPSRILVPLRAPIAGTVAESPVEVGDVVSPGQELISMVDMESLYVRANVHETRIAYVRVGQKARVRIRALRHDFEGEVQEISGATTGVLAPAQAIGGPSMASAVEIPIRLSITSEGYSLYPGLSADVKVRVGPRTRKSPWSRASS